MRTGIYVIIHNRTNKTYVGQSRNIERRREQHIRRLKNGNHHNSGLQRDWDNSPTNPYTFKLVYKLKTPEKYDDEELTDILDLLEWKFLKEFGKETEIYNIAKIRKPQPTNIPQELLDSMFEEEVWVLPEYRKPRRRKKTHYGQYLKLLQKYETRQPMEIWSTESYTDESKEGRINRYIQESHYIMDRMKLVGDQRNQLVYMVRTIPLKKLHRRMGYEKIIICLCIYIRKSYNDFNFKWEQYSIVKQYKLTINELLTVIINLCIHYNSNHPLPIINEKEEVENYQNRKDLLDYETYETITNLEKEVKYWKSKYGQLKNKEEHTCPLN